MLLFKESWVGHEILFHVLALFFVLQDSCLRFQLILATWFVLVYLDSWYIGLDFQRILVGEPIKQLLVNNIYFFIYDSFPIAHNVVRVHKIFGIVGVWRRRFEWRRQLLIDQLIPIYLREKPVLFDFCDSRSQLFLLSSYSIKLLASALK